MPAAGQFSDNTVQELLPGVQLFKPPTSRFLAVRVWNKDTQTYVRRSTKCLEPEEAKKWIYNNLQDLYSAKPVEKGGGQMSCTRQLAMHIDYLEQRCKAGEIAEPTFIVYQKCAKHFISWLALNKYKRLSQIKRASLVNYAMDRVNKDGKALNTANLEVTYFTMFWKWLQKNDIVSRHIEIPKLNPAVGERVKNEPFHPGDLKKIHQGIKEFVKGKDKEGMFGRKKETYNKVLFSLFIQLLEEGGFRQHEVMNRRWSDIKIGETLSDRKRIINTVIVPQRSKRGYRQHVFRGDSLINLRRYCKQNCVDWDTDDYIFRSKQTNRPINNATFARYWNQIIKPFDFHYVLHTFRSYRISQLILSGVDSVLVARNLGLSPNQINKSYLRFVPAGHWSELVQPDAKEDRELQNLMGDNDDI